MRELKIEKSHDINRLHEELEAAVSKLRPVEIGRERVAVMDLQERGDEIILRFPDEVDEAEVRRVIDAHAPKAKEPSPDLDALLDVVEDAGSPQAFQKAYVAYERAKHPERKRKTKK